LAVRHDGNGNPAGLSAERCIGEDGEDEDFGMRALGGVQEGSARLLAHLAFRDDMRDAIRHAGAIPALVALLKEGDEDAKVRVREGTKRGEGD